MTTKTLKTQLNIRVSQKTLKQIYDICNIWGETKTGVISQAVDELHRITCKELPKPTDPAQNK